MWDFIKKLTKTVPQKTVAPVKAPVAEKPAQELKQAAPHVPAALGEPLRRPAAQSPENAAAKIEKPHAQKTDDELVEELNKISPEILSQAKNPQMRKLVIDLYRKMLVEGVDVNNEKEVGKWLKKHPEVANGGDVQKVETVKRAGPKVGRNEPCPCGSGKKYKKCCGAGL
ncbi:MAG: hypothetical protein A2270_01775 [Elusimicrobia bacterium RIFOXYA12_FULL_51_18]|nr:MAG: hypothetical protein A2270_01775 [Elusimicrobia bacterium RIFOXYA12_FULL_51_18]OGS28359.1 MAG: hypothetical protein A2218_00215 [Elusimicrobia bacterium RIFOXYA2_FULL_53_38]